MQPPSKRLILLRDTGIVLVLNAAVAILLTLFVLSAVPDLAPQLRSRMLVQQMVYSQAIGLTIFCLMELPRLTWWWQRRPGLLAVSLVMAGAIPVGYLVGGTVAGWLTASGFAPWRDAGPFLVFVGLVTTAASLFAIYF